MLDTLTLDSATPLIGTVFQVAAGDGAEISLKLAGAVAFPTRSARPGRPAPKRSPFALYFVGPIDRVLPQGMYELRGESVTLPGLFIVPVGRDDAGTEYEAVFT